MPTAAVSATISPVMSLMLRVPLDFSETEATLVVAQHAEFLLQRRQYVVPTFQRAAQLMNENQVLLAAAGDRIAERHAVHFHPFHRHYS